MYGGGGIGVGVGDGAGIGVGVGAGVGVGVGDGDGAGADGAGDGDGALGDELLDPQVTADSAASNESNTAREAPWVAIARKERTLSPMDTCREIA